MDALPIIGGFIAGLAVLTPFLLRAKAILKEVTDLLVTLSAAVEDNKISMAEVAKILTDIKELLGAVKPVKK